MNIAQEHADQYKMLRDEVIKLIEESRKVETQAVFVVAVLYGWFLTNKTQPQLPKWAWFIPAVVAVLACIRSTALFKRVGLIASYLREIEKEYLTTPSSLPGWERFYKPKGGSNPISFSALVFWALLIFLTLITPFIIS